MSSLFDNFDKDRLFFTSYGEIIYLPRVDSTIKYDREKKTLTRTIPAHRELNGKPLPLSSEEGSLVPEVKKIVPKKNTILSQRKIGSTVKVTYFRDENVEPSTITFPGVSKVLESPRLLARTLGGKLEVTSITADGREWNPSSLVSEYRATPDSADFAEKMKAILDKAVTEVTEDGVPLFLYAEDAGFRSFVDAEIESIYSTLKRGDLPVYQSSGSKKSLIGPYFARLLAAHFFSSDYSSYLEEHKKYSKVLSAAVDTNATPEIPNLDEGVNFLPHQVYSAAFLRTRDVAMIDADPGAGKTLMMLADILDKVNSGVVKRPCIVMPNPLLGQQKIEIEAWTNNTINVIVLSTDTVSKMDPNAPEGQKGRRKYLTVNGKHSAGLVEAIKLVKSAPKNTIILTSYAWLRSTDDGDADIETPPYPRPDLLVNELGVDMVSLDESHFVRYNSKGELAARTEAIGQLGALVKYKRCFSGSIAPNTPEDIFLQASFLDRSLFGSIDSFRNTYGSSKNKHTGKVETWKPSAIKSMKAKLGSSIGLSIRRAAWISKLPNLHTTHHEIPVSPLQLRAYKAILGKELPDTISGASPTAKPASIIAAIREIINRFRAVEQLAYTDADEALVTDFKGVLDSVGAFAYESQTIGDSRLYPSDLFSKLARIQGSQSYSKVLSAETRLVREVSSGSSLSGARAQAYNKKVYEARLAKLKAAGDTDSIIEAKKSGVSAVVANSSKGGKKKKKKEKVVPEEVLVATEDLSIYSDLEQFLGDPTSHYIGDFMLSAEGVSPTEKVSPKVKKIDQILDAHFKSGDNGKVLIYTNTRTVARHLYNNIALRRYALYYDASEQKALDRFKKDPSVKILVAVVSSLTEGHNLQMANRIINVDLPWMPGSYDQALARAYRLPPRSKQDESYSDVYVDILLCAKTFEFTKYARLIAKMQQTRKLTSDYDSGIDLEQLKMNTDTIASRNDSSHIQAYLEEFKVMRDTDLQLGAASEHLYRTPSKSLSSGKLLEGGKKIAVPYTESDLRRSPHLEDRSADLMGVLSPTLLLLNDVWRLSFSNTDTVPPPGLFRGTNSGRPYSFPTRVIKGLRVTNINEITRNISALADTPFLDNESAQALLDIGRRMLRTADWHTVTASTIPTRMTKDLRGKLYSLVRLDPEALTIASSVFPDESSLVNKLYLAAALSAGVLSLSLPLSDEDKSTLAPLFSRPPPKKLVRHLTDIAQAAAAPTPATTGVPVPVPVPVSPDPEASSVSDLTEDNTSSSSAQQSIDDSDFTMVSLTKGGTPKDNTGEKEVYIAYTGGGHVSGFEPIEDLSHKTFYSLGESAAAVSNSLAAFSRRVYPSGYSIKDLDSFIALLERAGVSSSDIEYSFGSSATGIIEVEDQPDSDSFEDSDDGTPNVLMEGEEHDDEEAEGAEDSLGGTVPSIRNLNFKTSSLRAYPEYESLTRFIFGE